jgi:CRP/FNR family transcriptional regulator, cyclic AMP receptor protein
MPSLSSRKLLQFSEVLALFPQPLRDQLYASAAYKDFRASATIFKQGDDGPWLGCVMEGRLRMDVAKDQKEMLVTMVEKGELFGEMSVFDDFPRAVNITAETDCKILTLHRDKFIPLLKLCPDAMVRLLQMSCHRMRLYLQSLEFLSLQNLPMRLVHYLLRLAKDYGTERDGKIIISAHLSQMDIARALACTRESVNKQLAIFMDKKLLSLNGEDIILLDIEGLKKAVVLGD